MRRYRVLAQHMHSPQRIAKVVLASNETAAIRLVWAELESAGYYPLSATPV